MCFLWLGRHRDWNIIGILQSLKEWGSGEVAQLCPTLCNPMDYNWPGSFVPGLFQARILEWVAISFSKTGGCGHRSHYLSHAKRAPYHWKKVKSFSHVRLFATPWTVAQQAPLSIGFSRQEYWSGLPFPSPGDLPDPGIEPGSPAL